MNIEAKDSQIGAYFEGRILDCKVGQIFVRFHPSSAAQVDKWVPAADCRGTAQPATDYSYLSPGCRVEVQAQTEPEIPSNAPAATCAEEQSLREQEPFGWWLAIVKSLKDDYCLVRFPGLGDDFDDIIHRDSIRPPNMSPPIDLTRMTRIELQLPASLKSSTITQFGQAPGNSLNNTQASSGILLFDQITKDSGAIAVTYDCQRHAVVVVASSQSLHKAKLLVDLHVDHLLELEAIKARTEKNRQRLIAEQNKASSACIEEFTVLPSLVGLVIGTKGAHILAIKNQNGVESVNVTPDGKVRIVATSREICQLARSRLEYVQEDFPIESEALMWIMGKERAFLKEITKKTGASSIVAINGPVPCLRMTGLLDAVSTARMLIHSRLSYLNTFESVQREERLVFDQLHQFMAEKSIGNTYARKANYPPTERNAQSQQPNRPAQGNSSVVPGVVAQNKETRQPRKQNDVPAQPEGIDDQEKSAEDSRRRDVQDDAVSVSNDTAEGVIDEIKQVKTASKNRSKKNKNRKRRDEASDSVAGASAQAAAT